MTDDDPLRHPQQLNDLLLFRLHRINATAGPLVMRMCERDYGITRREWRVLAVLEKEQGILPSQLAERVQLDRARISRAITSLVGKRLVAREPKPGNRREAVLTLTDKGQQVYDGMLPLAVDINRALTAVLTPDDARRLDAMLDRMQARAEGLVADAELPKADRRRGGTRSPTRA